MELKTYFAQDASGNIMPGATVTVYEAGTATLATGLQDESGSPLANPFTADSSAKVAFYAPDGLYDITVVGNGRTVTIRAQFVSVDGASVLRTDLAATGGSALVGFQQAGAGATARTAQDKLREIVSVKDFGAKGDWDGTTGTDDTVAINAALSSGAKRVRLIGHSKVTGPLTVPDGVDFVGEGGASITAFMGAQAVVISLGVGASAENVSVYGGNRTAAASTLGVAQGYNYDANVIAVNLSGGASASKVHAEGCYLGFQSSEKQNITLDDCSTLETGWGAVSFYHCGNVKINGGTFYKCGGFGGVMLPSCHDFAVNNATVYNKTGTGINPGGSAAANYNVERGTVTNCIVEAGDGINFENGAIDCTVVGNIVTINSELGSTNGVGVGFLSHSGGGPVSNNTIAGNTIKSKTGGEGIKFGSLDAAQYIDRVNVAANTIRGVRVGVYLSSTYVPRDCQIFGNVISADTGGVWIGGPAKRLEVAHNNVTSSSSVTIGNYYGIAIFNTLSSSRIQDNITTGWGVHYRQEAVCTNTEIINIRTFSNEGDSAGYTEFSSSVTPAIQIRSYIRAVSAFGVASSYSFSPTAQMGLIALDASVSFTPASNQSSSVWLYMNSVNGAGTGYTDTGISVVKIAGLKHDYDAAIADCSLVGSTTSDTITISAGGFNVFSVKEITLL